MIVLLKSLIDLIRVFGWILIKDTNDPMWLEIEHRSLEGLKMKNEREESENAWRGGFTFCLD